MFLLDVLRIDEDTVDEILHAGALAAREEAVVDSLLHHHAVLSRGVDEEQQVLSFPVLADDVGVADRVLDDAAEFCREALEDGALLHGIAFAVHDGAQHDVNGLAAALHNALDHPIDAEEYGIRADEAAGVRLIPAGELQLDLVQHGVGVLELLSQLLQEVHGAEGRLVAELIQVAALRELVELPGVVLSSLVDEAFHGEDFPLGEGLHLGRVAPEFLQTGGVVVHPHECRGALHALGEDLAVAAVLLGDPDEPGLRRQEFAGVGVDRLQVEGEFCLRIPLVLGLVVEALELGGVLSYGDGIGPVVAAVPVVDIGVPGQALLLKALAGVV